VAIAKNLPLSAKRRCQGKLYDGLAQEFWRRREDVCNHSSNGHKDHADDQADQTTVAGKAQDISCSRKVADRRTVNSAPPTWH